jgi:predicted SprT family Zn-dependent metalloprotease
MKRKVIEKFSELKKQHPELKGYQLIFGNAVQTLGSCDYARRKIKLSNHHINGSAPVEVMNTLLHEVAHAIARNKYHQKGHGDAWKKVCLEIGAKPERTSVAYQIKKPKAKWIRYCPTCGKESKRNRRAKLLCRKCYNKGIKSEIKYRGNE